MRSELARALKEMKAQYDSEARKILSHKMILAYILANCVEEFQGLDPEAIVPLIEGEPVVDTIPILPGSLNWSDESAKWFEEVERSIRESDRAKGNVGEAGTRISGSDTADKVSGEGEITFDIRFHAYAEVRRCRVKLLVDVEAQKEFHPGYDIVTRGFFYTSRMISAQYGTEFERIDYNNVKKVYSIWICMNAPGYAADTITEYCIQQKNRVGDYPEDKNRYDLARVIMIGLGRRVSEEQKLHRLLGVIFAFDMKVSEKMDILEQEFHIPMTEEVKGEVERMCNLSDAIEERGIEKGIKQGIELERANTEKANARVEKANARAEKANERAEVLQNQLNELKKQLALKGIVTPNKN